MTTVCPHRPADLVDNIPGEVVWVCILNALENRFAQGKWRPAVLIQRHHGHWLTMGLTTNPRYRDGAPRSPIPRPSNIGLRTPGYLWGDRLTTVSVGDVGDHIGWVDLALADLIITTARLPHGPADELRAAATRHLAECQRSTGVRRPAT